MVDVNELAEAVLKMRTAQKRYFRTRQAKWLSESKDLELCVDELLKTLAGASVAIREGLTEQTRLFD